MGAKFVGWGAEGRGRYRLDDGRELDLRSEEVAQYMDTDHGDVGPAPWQSDIAAMEQTVEDLEANSYERQLPSEPVEPTAEELGQGLLGHIAPGMDMSPIEQDPMDPPLARPTTEAATPAVPQTPPEGLPPGVGRMSEMQSFRGVMPHASREYPHGFVYMGPDQLPNTQDVYSGIVDAAVMEDQALAHQQQAEGQLADETNKVIDRKNAARIEYQNQEKMKQRLGYHERKRATDRIDKAIEKANRGVDRDRYFNENSWKALAGMFSAGIEGFLNPGQPSKTVDLAMQMIEQDMAAQQSEIDSEWRNVDQMERGYGRLMGEQQRLKEQRAEHYAYALSALDSELAKKQNQYQSEVQKSKIQQQRAALGSRIAEVRHQLGQEAFENGYKAAQLQNDALTREGDMTHKENMLKLDKSKFAWQRKMDRAKAAEEAEDPYISVGVAPDGSIIRVPRHLANDFTKKEVEDSLQKWKANAGVAEAIRNIQKATATYGRALKFNPYDKDARVAYKQARSAFIRSMRDEVGANLPKDERKNAEALAPTPEQLLGNPDHYFNLQGNYIKQLETDTDRVVQHRGLVAVDPKTGEARVISRGAGGTLSEDFGAYGSPKEAQVVSPMKMIDHLEDEIKDAKSVTGVGKEAALGRVAAQVEQLAEELESGRISAKEYQDVYKRAEEVLNQLPEEDRNMLIFSDQGWPQHYGAAQDYVKGVGESVDSAKRREIERAPMDTVSAGRSLMRRVGRATGLRD